jgi:N-acetylmuramoyl-L-alanine amidase
MRDINRIYVHHSASSRSTTVAQIRTWHLGKTPPWSDIGYHKLIRQAPWDSAASVQIGRPIRRQGAHVYGDNANSVGVCLIGNFHEERLPAEMGEALVMVLVDLCRRFDLDHTAIFGHREYVGANTVCPGKNVNMDLVRDLVREALVEECADE